MVSLLVVQVVSLAVSLLDSQVHSHLSSHQDIRLVRLVESRLGSLQINHRRSQVASLLVDLVVFQVANLPGSQVCSLQ